MMENNIKVRHNPHQRHRANLKKSTRYKDSLSKYKDTIPKLIQKQTIIPTLEQNESKMNMKNLRKGLMEFKAEIRKKEIPSIFESTTSYGWRINQRYSFSAPKNHFLRVNTPKRNYLRREKNINHHTPISLYRSHTKNDEFKEKRNRNDKISDIFSSSFRTMTRSRSRPTRRTNIHSSYNYNELSLKPRRITLHTDRMNNLLTKSYAGESTKGREASAINNILQKQNKELRQKVREMRYKINDLLNKIKSIRIDSQRAEFDKKQLSMKINSLENELDINNTMKLNELENKSKTIAQLNDEIFSLYALLDEKENLIIKLSNNIGNYGEEIKYDDNNKGFNKGKTIYYKKQKFKDRNNFGDDDDLRRLNKDELINEINDLKKQIENLNYEKENTERKNKNMNKNLLDNDDRIFENKEKISTLVQENKNFKIMNQKLKYESQKMKNYYTTLLNKQKISLENQQKEYQKNLNDLGQKLNVLKDEKNALKNDIDNVSFNNLTQNQKMSDNENVNNQLLEQLIEENIMLKTQLNEKSQELKNNNFNEGNNYENNFQEINYLKKDLENKNNEINNLQEKLKNLLIQMNSFKNNKEVLMSNITELEQKINQLNSKVNSLENDILNKQQQIIDLKNLNSKLLIQVNNNKNNYQPTYNNNDLNYNEELEQKITLLEKKNDELQEQLVNNEENKNNKINQIIFEKNNLIKENYNLKEEILSLKNKINELKNKNNIKETENQKLLDIIKNKEIENAKLQNVLDSSKRGSEDGSIVLGDNIDIYLSQKIEEQNTQIENMEKEINSYRSKNDKLYLQYSALKEKLDNIQNKPDEELLISIDNLKEQLKDKDSQITKLIKENNDLRKNANNNNEEEKEIDLNNNKNIKKTFRNTLNSEGLNEGDRIKLLKDEIKNYKLENDSDKMQIKTLKEDIKIMMARIKDLETFGGQMKNMTEFFSLLNQALLNYEPKKKEQKEALNKIMIVLNISKKKK